MADVTPHVYLVAGNRLLREALAKVLKKKGDCNVCGVSPCLPDIVSVAVTSGANVLILDSITARLSDCSFISEITRQMPNMKIILIDMSDDPKIFLECVRAGALGYLLSDASSAEVVAGVHAVARGQAVCPPQLCIHLFRAFSHPWMPAATARIEIDFGLTRRQQQLLPLISQGLTNKEIASHLGISEQTVKNHMHGIMRRIGVTNRFEVIDHTRSWAAFQ